MKRDIDSIHASDQSTYGILQHMYEAYGFNQIGAGPRVESNEVCGIELDRHQSVLYAQSLHHYFICNQRP